MKPLTLQELHAIDLEILKEIDAFCRPRGIRYSLSFGSLLGAVRHKGFIPWDDDIDLVMPREDYDRFRKEFTSSKFRFIDRESNPACWKPFSIAFSISFHFAQSYLSLSQSTQIYSFLDENSLYAFAILAHPPIFLGFMMCFRLG